MLYILTFSISLALVLRQNQYDIMMNVVKVMMYANVNGGLFLAERFYFLILIDGGWRHVSSKV
jgi:hypothetical protein